MANNVFSDFHSLEIPEIEDELHIDPNSREEYIVEELNWIFQTLVWLFMFEPVLDANLSETEYEAIMSAQ